MPSGTGAVNLRNLPNVKYEINPAKFFALTEKNVFPPLNFPLPAPANYSEQQLLQVGVVSTLRLIYKGTVTYATAGTAGSLSSTFKWPYGVLSNFTLSGNGQNNFFNCSGYDLYLRQLVQYRAFVDGYTVATLPSNTATTTTSSTNVQVQWEVPISMDMTTLIGSLYAQSEATNLSFVWTTESIANLFTGANGSTITLAGSVYVEEIFFDVPYDPGNAGTLVIPDLRVLHGYIANNNPVAGLAEVTTNLYRVNGQLERLFFYYDNNNALISEVGAAPSWIQSRLVYGGSTTPYNLNPQDHLVVINNQDYRDILPAGVAVLDFVKDNPARDQILLEGVSNLRLITDTGNGFTPNAACKFHFVQETLFA